MAMRPRTWIWIVAGIAVVGILGIVAMAAAGLYFATRHIETRSASPGAAAREFDDVRRRFEGQKPLIELDPRGRLIRTNPDRAAPDPSEPSPVPHNIYVLAFEPTEERIVRLSVPFWLLRFKLRGTRIDLGGSRLDLEDLKITVEELERMGPTLIVDHEMTSGERVLVWSQ